MNATTLLRQTLQHARTRVALDAVARTLPWAFAIAAIAWRWQGAGVAVAVFVIATAIVVASSS